jgi:hypothetical protein
MLTPNLGDTTTDEISLNQLGDLGDPDIADTSETPASEKEMDTTSDATGRIRQRRQPWKPPDTNLSVTDLWLTEPVAALDHLLAESMPDHPQLAFCHKQLLPALGHRSCKRLVELIRLGTFSCQTFNGIPLDVVETWLTIADENERISAILKHFLSPPGP